MPSRPASAHVKNGIVSSGPPDYVAGGTGWSPFHAVPGERSSIEVEVRCTILDRLNHIGTVRAVTPLESDYPRPWSAKVWSHALPTSRTGLDTSSASVKASTIAKASKTLGRGTPIHENPSSALRHWRGPFTWHLWC